MYQISPHRLTKEQQHHIQQVYDAVRSIHRTAKVTGHSPVTVRKYIRINIENASHSIWQQNTILKIDPKTGHVMQEYTKPSVASQLTRLSASNINHCLAGRTSTAGGWVWIYKKDFDPSKDYKLKRYHYSETAFMNRLLGLNAI